MEFKNNRSFGAAGEEIAAEFLVKSGYKILETNFRVGRLGEVDLIAREKDYYCFIEVKTRSNMDFGRPCEAITKRKMAYIKMIAIIYIKKHNLVNKNIRFDVVEVLVSNKLDNLEVKSINLIKNAFC